MLKAIKENKVYKINEAEKAGYLSEGYDIYEDGSLVEKSAKATVPYAEYKRLRDENEQLKSKLKAEKKPAVKKPANGKDDELKDGGE